MFVTKDDFGVPPYNLPDVALTLTENSFTDFVERQEKILLNELLGKKLCKAFYDGLSVTPPENIDPKWIALRDGADYEVYYMDPHYGGIKEFMIPYIVAMWTRANYDNNAITGVAVNNVENAETITPSIRIVRCYNEMVTLVGNHGNQVDTFYGFMVANQDLYTDWLFDEPDYMNLWNI